jgi:porin
MALEATYLMQITKWLSIQPDLQVIINPGGDKGLSNAFVLGGRLSITF